MAMPGLRSPGVIVLQTAYLFIYLFIYLLLTNT